MKKADLSYRVFSCGLILMLIASFTLPTMAACAMAGQDCHDEVVKDTSDCCDEAKESSHCDIPAAADCPPEVKASCETSECTLKQAPGKANLVEFDRAQVNKYAAIVVSFVVTHAEPIITHSEKVQDFTTLYSDSSPIYLMNQVLLN